MAVPFRRKSSTRVRKGRSPSNWKFTTTYSSTAIIRCNQGDCKGLKMLHRICPSCSKYKGISL